MIVAIERRIADYAYRHWMRHGMTEWPTVSRVARALRIRQDNVEEAANGEHLILTSYYMVPPPRLGEHFVEATTEAVESAWAAYWRPYARSPRNSPSGLQNPPERASRPI